MDALAQQQRASGGGTARHLDEADLSLPSAMRRSRSTQGLRRRPGHPSRPQVGASRGSRRGHNAGRDTPPSVQLPPTSTMGMNDVGASSPLAETEVDVPNGSAGGKDRVWRHITPPGQVPTPPLSVASSMDYSRSGPVVRAMPGRHSVARGELRGGTGSGGGGGNSGSNGGAQGRGRAVSGADDIEDPTNPERANVVEVYGFVGWLLAWSCYITFLVWAFASEEWLHSIGIAYYPSQYWALALPSWMIVVWVLIVTIYVGINLLTTAPLDSFDTLTDPHARRVSERRQRSLMERAGPPATPEISDIPIEVVNRVLFQQQQTRSGQRSHAKHSAVAAGRPASRASAGSQGPGGGAAADGGPLHLRVAGRGVNGMHQRSSSLFDLNRFGSTAMGSVSDAEGRGGFGVGDVGGGRRSRGGGGGRAADAEWLDGGGSQLAAGDFGRGSEGQRHTQHEGEGIVVPSHRRLRSDSFGRSLSSSALAHLSQQRTVSGTTSGSASSASTRGSAQLPSRSGGGTASSGSEGGSRHRAP